MSLIQLCDVAHQMTRLRSLHELKVNEVMMNDASQWQLSSQLSSVSCQFVSSDSRARDDVRVRHAPVELLSKHHGTLTIHYIIERKQI